MPGVLEQRGRFRRVRVAAQRLELEQRVWGQCLQQGFNSGSRRLPPLKMHRNVTISVEVWRILIWTTRNLYQDAARIDAGCVHGPTTLFVPPCPAAEV
jgi:hypothetical protein